MAGNPIDPRIRNEQVLSRKLSAGQQAMMAIGGAIGTGLFLGSGLAVNVAILGSTWWVPDLRITLVAGGPWLAVLAAGYLLTRASWSSRAPGKES